MFVPRIVPRAVIREELRGARGGFGMFADQRYFSELSASASIGISETLRRYHPGTFYDFSCPNVAGCLMAVFSSPLTPPPTNITGVANLVYNMSQLSGCAEPVFFQLCSKD